MSYNLRASDKTVAPAQAIKLAQGLWETIDTPVSLGLWLRVKYRHFRDVTSVKFKPLNYNDRVRAGLDYQAISVVRKADFLETGIDRRKAAIKKFWDSERRCAETNLRFDDLMYGSGLKTLNTTNPKMVRLLLKARTLIEKILGTDPSLVCRYEDARFGPGATYLVGGGKKIHLPNKYSHKMAVTPELFLYLPTLLGPRWFSQITEIELRKGNKVGFVNKDATIERVIATEPDGNILAQLMIAAGIRRRFDPYVNLNEGASWNRYLASVAYDWRLSTVDFSSASDTIARALVAFLLPEQWWLLLDTARSHQFNIDGKWYVSNKFSSMGNGATFELESIIFYALARACGSSRALTTVFGDDVILETGAFADFEELAEFCGFQVNEEKTFSESAFYESCGEDYFESHNIRPFFWKQLNTQSVFKMYNDLKRFASRYGIPSAGILAEKELFSRSPPELQECLVPECLTHDGDFDSSGFGVPFDRALPYIKKPRRGFCGMSTKALMFLPKKERTYGWGGLMATLHSHERRKTSRMTWLDEPGVVFSESAIRGRGTFSVQKVTILEW